MSWGYLEDDLIKIGHFRQGRASSRERGRAGEQRQSRRPRGREEQGCGHLLCWLAVVLHHPRPPAGGQHCLWAWHPRPGTRAVRWAPPQPSQPAGATRPVPHEVVAAATFIVEQRQHQGERREQKRFWVEQKSHQSREQGPTWCRHAVLPPDSAGKDRHVLRPRLSVPHTFTDLLLDQGLHQPPGFRGRDKTVYRTPSSEGCAQRLMRIISLHPLSSSGATLFPLCSGGKDTGTYPRPHSTGREAGNQTQAAGAEL